VGFAGRAGSEAEVGGGIVDHLEGPVGIAGGDLGGRSDGVGINLVLDGDGMDVEAGDADTVELGGILVVADGELEMVEQIQLVILEAGVTGRGLETEGVSGFGCDVKTQCRRAWFDEGMRISDNKWFPRKLDAKHSLSTSVRPNNFKRTNERKHIYAFLAAMLHSPSDGIVQLPGSHEDGELVQVDVDAVLPLDELAQPPELPAADADHANGRTGLVLSDADLERGRLGLVPLQPGAEVLPDLADGGLLGGLADRQVVELVGDLRLAALYELRVNGDELVPAVLLRGHAGEQDGADGLLALADDAAGLLLPELVRAEGGRLLGVGDHVGTLLLHLLEFGHLGLGLLELLLTEDLLFGPAGLLLAGRRGVRDGAEAQEDQDRR